MSTNTLVPQYLDMDFSTMKSRLSELLAANATFKDYNYEGANITVLMELVCYLGALTTYYANQIAKNQYIDTADLYETVHMLSRLRGYNPAGYISSSTDLTVTLTLSGGSGGVSTGDQISFNIWDQINCTGDVVDADGNTVQFAIIPRTDFNYSPTISGSGTYTYTIPVKQGTVYTDSFTGADIVDNILYLPTYNFDYDDDIDDIDASMELYVNKDLNPSPWSRISDFYDEITGLLAGLSTVDNVYMMRYNKYGKYLVEFSSARNIPSVGDSIEVTLLKSAGTYGNVGVGKITTPANSSTFIYNNTTGEYINVNSYVTVTNITAVTGGSDPESITDIKAGSTGAAHSQYRNITAYDYVTYLEDKSNVLVANVWGEQEVAPSGSELLYNKVYVSVIPSEWGTGTIEISSSGDISVPTVFTDIFQNDLAAYLEPRKMLCAYEEYTLPELIYFGFDIGIKILRTYIYSDVANDVRNKLAYYFSPINRSFAETISFTDIMEYITNPANVSPTDSFSKVKGISTLIIRNIDTLNGIVINDYGSGLYPCYAESGSWYSSENTLRYITLGFNQFPALSLDNCTFLQET